VLAITTVRFPGKDPSSWQVLATICLFPVDIALVSTTVDKSTGLRKPWASPERVANIVFSLKIVYYGESLEEPWLTVVLYGVDALFCLLIIPFSYFWYEEWDEESTLGSRVQGALKYSVLFLVITIALLLTGFFIPISKDLKSHIDFDYFKHLLTENRTATCPVQS
jgi:LMBR1 domain-containing protein 1